MSILLATSLQVTAILLLGLAAAALLRKQSAALRHWVLASAVLCAAVTPFLSRVVPAWDVDVEKSLPSLLARPDTTAAEIGGPAHVEPAVVQATDSSSTQTVTAARLLLWAWLVGIAVHLSFLIIGLARLMWIASASRSVRDESWRRLTERIAGEYGLSGSVRLLQTNSPTLLATWGFPRANVLLPRGAAEWSDDCVHCVLSHELAHVVRRDWWVHMAAELLRCIHWFNPVLWIVCRRLRQESEQACDDMVLNRGIDGTEYATHLVSLVRAFQQERRTWLPALAMARSSSLERRIHMMLDARSNRSTVTRLARIGTVALLLGVAVPLAGLGAQTAFSSFSGAVFDESDGSIANVVLVLTNLQSLAKHEVRSDSNGRFEFVGLVPGDYALEAKYPGFSVLRGSVTLSGNDVRQDVRLEIGSLEETVTVRDTKPTRSQEVFDQLEQLKREIESRRKRANLSTCAASPLGGNIRPPLKLHNVPPEYPQQLRDANTGGFVRLQGRIGTDGSFKELWVQQSAGSAADQAALEAVREWKFSETLLNCVPVEVPITVNVMFESQ